MGFYIKTDSNGTPEQTADSILAHCPDPVKDALYRSIWFDHVCKDILSRMEDLEDEDDEYGNPLTEAQVQYAASRYVYDGEYDCNLSYWDNIDRVIELAREFCPPDGKDET